MYALCVRTHAHTQFSSAAPGSFRLVLFVTERIFLCVCALRESAELRVFANPTPPEALIRPQPPTFQREKELVREPSMLSSPPSPNPTTHPPSALHHTPEIAIAFESKPLRAWTRSHTNTQTRQFPICRAHTHTNIDTHTHRHITPCARRRRLRSNRAKCLLMHVLWPNGPDIDEISDYTNTHA